MKVIFDTGYSDEKDGQVHGGIDTKGTTDEHGSYTNTWTVAPGTPPGEAKVLVGAVDNAGTGHGRATFQVALTCP